MAFQALPGIVKSLRHPIRLLMATNTGKGSRKGSVDHRTQVRNLATGDYIKRNEDPKSSHDGKFMAVKKDGAPLKGIAKEPDSRRGRELNSEARHPAGSVRELSLRKAEHFGASVYGDGRIRDEAGSHPLVEPRSLPTRQRMTVELAQKRAAGRPDDPPFDGVAFLRKLR